MGYMDRYKLKRALGEKEKIHKLKEEGALLRARASKKQQIRVLEKKNEEYRESIGSSKGMSDFKSVASGVGRVIGGFGQPVRPQQKQQTQHRYKKKKIYVRNKDGTYTQKIQKVQVKVKQQQPRRSSGGVSSILPPLGEDFGFKGSAPRSSIKKKKKKGFGSSLMEEGGFF